MSALVAGQRRCSPCHFSCGNGCIVSFVVEKCRRLRHQHSPDARVNVAKRCKVYLLRLLFSFDFFCSQRMLALSSASLAALQLLLL